MLQKGNGSINFARDNFDVFFPVKSVVNLHTKVFSFYNHFEFIVKSFQFLDLISSFQEIQHFSGGHEHKM